METQIQRRVGYNTSGKEIEVMMNAYPITSFPDKAVYQYEVSVFFLPLLNDSICSSITRSMFSTETKMRLTGGS